MHLLITAVLIGFVFWKGDWRHYQKYVNSIFYVIICNLLYNLLSKDQLLWHYEPDFLPKSYTAVELLYSFFILPSIVLLFLSNYPFAAQKGKQIRYILSWTVGSLLVEYPFYKMNRILLENGYMFWMEAVFYPLMYTMTRLHHTRPLLTYGLSIPIILFMLKYFHISIK